MGLAHMSGDRVLRQTGSTCTWYSRTGSTETRDANGTLNRADTYGPGTPLICMVGQPSRHWKTQWAEADLIGSIECYIPVGTNILPRDKVTFDGLDYRAIDLSKWPGVGPSVLLQRIDGIT